MASSATLSTLRTYLTNNFVLAPFVWPNEGASIPVDDSPFIDVSFPLADSERITIGSPGSEVTRETGTLRLNLYAPLGVGVEPYLTWVETLRSILRYKTLGGGLKFWEPSTPALYDSSDYGGRFCFSVVVEFYLDTIV